MHYGLDIFYKGQGKIMLEGSVLKSCQGTPDPGMMG